MAVASDTDLEDLFAKVRTIVAHDSCKKLKHAQDSYPSDLAAALREIQPRIHVESGPQAISGTKRCFISLVMPVG